MKTITASKPFDEIQEIISRAERIYLIGCGTCATMCHTGGEAEVLQMEDKLKEIGKMSTGWMVIPIVCDELTKEALRENAKAIQHSECVLVMSCAFGVQTIANYIDKPVYPALDTLFVGRKDSPGHYSQICLQCGQCVLGQYAGICPLTQCAKGLLNGPCGGSKNGKCEQEPEHDCGWIVIYERLKKLGELDKIKEFVPPKDYSKMKRPRTFKVSEAV